MNLITWYFLMFFCLGLGVWTDSYWAFFAWAPEVLIFLMVAGLLWHWVQPSKVTAGLSLPLRIKALLTGGLTFVLRVLPFVAYFTLIYGLLLLIGLLYEPFLGYMLDSAIQVKFVIVAMAATCIAIVNKATEIWTRRYASLLGITSMIYAFGEFGWKFGLLTSLISGAVHLLNPCADTLPEDIFS